MDLPGRIPSHRVIPAIIEFTGGSALFRKITGIFSAITASGCPEKTRIARETANRLMNGGFLRFLADPHGDQIVLKTTSNIGTEKHESL